VLNLFHHTDQLRHYILRPINATPLSRTSSPLSASSTDPANLLVAFM
jgi:hypothetical protein